MWLSLFSSSLGFAILVLRLGPVLRTSFTSTPTSSLAPAPKFPPAPAPDAPVTALAASTEDSKLVSLIIPARNEATNLPRLFRSLIDVQRECGPQGWRLEIIVVDDQSTDSTLEICLRFREDFLRHFAGVKVEIIRGLPCPEDWTGKNWACHQGFRHAQGQFILFTDADTEQYATGWTRVLRRMEQENLSMLSAVPYHRCETWWERWAGVFQILIILSTAAFNRPRPRRLFAIGQFLLFRREAYLRQGGHESVRATLADDLELARLCMKNGGLYAVEGLQPVFRVRMYDSFASFLQGWRRIFRLGLQHASIMSVVEVYFLIALLTANMRFAAAPVFCQLLALSGILVFLLVQKRFGQFSVVGAVLWPVGLFLFLLVSGLALFDLSFSRRFVWRDRTYSSSGEGPS